MSSLSLSLSLLAACRKEEEPPRLPLPAFVVDAAVTPAATTLPGPGGVERPLGAVTDGAHTATFVEEELLLSTGDDALLAAFLARWDGEVRATLTFDAALAVPPLHLVAIDASLADPAGMAEDLRSVDPGARGSHRVSSDRALGTLAAAAAEGAAGLAVGLDWVGEGATIADRDVGEAPNGPWPAYTPNPFDWSHFRDGADLDIGVAEAWRALDRAGRLVPGTIPVAVIDGGFRTGHADYPSTPDLRSGIPWVPDELVADLSNTMTCGGAPCPWHGTVVSLAAWGAVDNGLGAAGVAGPVARPHQVTTLGDWFTGVHAVTLAAARGARVINLSYGSPVPGVFAFTNGPFEATTAALRASGVLLFAAAGNTHDDVDDEDCFVVCWESTLHTPCENEGVDCVGGTRFTTPERHPDSSFGHDDRTTGTVDLAGPYEVYGQWPDFTDLAPTTVEKVGGTSVSSPFVAGVAALIWAADPSRSADEVEQLLLSTAHPLPGTGVKRLVDAHEAVLQALEDVPPPPTHTGETTPTHTGGPPDCDVVGTWSGPVPAGPFAGRTNDWTLRRDGTTHSEMGAATVEGAWSLDGATLTVTDTSAVPAYVACAAGQEGTYDVAFADACGTLTLTLATDPCAGRRVALDGFTAARR
jgi:serine protease